VPSIYSGRRHPALTLPLSRQLFHLVQNLLNVLHAVGDAVGHGGRDGLFVVAKYEAGALQCSEAFRQHARGDSLDLPPKHSKAHRSVVTESPKNV